MSRPRKSLMDESVGNKKERERELSISLRNQRPLISLGSCLFPFMPGVAPSQCDSVRLKKISKTKNKNISLFREWFSICRPIRTRYRHRRSDTGQHPPDWKSFSIFLFFFVTSPKKNLTEREREIKKTTIENSLFIDCLAYTNHYRCWHDGYIPPAIGMPSKKKSNKIIRKEKKIRHSMYIRAG